MNPEVLTSDDFAKKIAESEDYISASKLADELALAGVIAKDYMYTAKRASSQCIIIIQKALDKIKE